MTEHIGETMRATTTIGAMILMSLSSLPAFGGAGCTSCGVDTERAALSASQRLGVEDEKRITLNSSISTIAYLYAKQHLGIATPEIYIPQHQNPDNLTAKILVSGQWTEFSLNSMIATLGLQ